MPNPRRHIRNVSTALYLRPRALLWLLLAPPLLWFAIFYIAPLAVLLSQSLLRFDDFTMAVTSDFTLNNFTSLVTDQSNLDIVVRTFATALAVTVACGCLGYPVAYFMARHASARVKGLMYVAVMVPMWASYIVKAYAWTVLLAAKGPITASISALGATGLLKGILAISWIGGTTLSTSHLGRFIVFTYMWLPFMILPIQAAVERIPRNVVLASVDLGGNPRQTFFGVILPLSIPGVAAGSIFTFCLTFGDYILPSLVGPSGDFLGMAVYRYQGAIGNIPLAAAMTVIPIVVVGAWLWLAKKLGAFDAL